MGRCATLATRIRSTGSGGSVPSVPITIYAAFVTMAISIIYDIGSSELILRAAKGA